MPRREVHREYSVYILASDFGVLYTGVTNDLARRVEQHRAEQGGRSFTSRHRVHRLVYFETTPSVLSAIEREKQIKSWRRSKKLALIREMNPRFEDLLPPEENGSHRA